ncbi:GNAT family N-acetyltransferase [Pseudoalteromonas sp. NZS71_1]|uniref:GNAT family N-acetyltransferase n=1 Tax=Pseudoalteromonas sp. NZS71_1 TaxID=2792072 RepID=UPI0018CF6422|nr:GNAT family N-acetyltransferase [Pseudoalteromonas sp. NZS71_1]MBH0036788.1 GNAT family N-acetyltransferase [Pseudoalteromonas sp. NZS71_1]
MKFEIKEIDWNDSAVVNNISTLLNTSFNTYKNPMFDPQFLLWKHRDNPFGTSISLLAYDEDGNILGLRTFLKWQFINNEKSLCAYQPVDTATTPAARGKGVFSELTRVALNIAGDSIIYNTPNANSLPGYLKMGWNHTGDIKFGVIPRVVPCYKRCNNIFDFDEKSIELLVGMKKEHLSDNKLTTRKSYDFLKWRFLDIPHINYRIFWLSDECYCVYHIKVRNTFRELTVCELSMSKKESIGYFSFHSQIQALLNYEKCSYAVIGFKDIATDLQKKFFRLPLKHMKFLTKSSYDFNLTLTEVEIF